MSSDVAREQSWGTGESLRLVLSLNGSWGEGRLPKMIFQTTGMTGFVCVGTLYPRVNQILS